MNRGFWSCIFIFCLFMLLSTQQVGLHFAYPQDSEVEQAEKKLIEAFKAVKKAESAGARKEELVELVSKLNQGLLLLEKVRKGEIEEAAISNVIEVFEGVISEAIELEMHASSRLVKIKVFLFLAVPMASIITAFGLNFAYKWWRRREIERILRMIAKKKEERTS